MIPEFSGYIEDEEWLRASIDLGYGKVLIEEPHFSLLCKKDLKDQIDYSFIESLVNKGKKLKQDLKIIFNLDIILHNDNIERVREFIQTIHSIGIDGIRVQEIGTASLVRETSPNLALEMNTVTGNCNHQAIAFLEERLKPHLKTIVYSKEIPYKDLKIINQMSTLKNELLVHGPILLFYTKRRLIKESDFNLESIEGLDRYSIFLKEKKRPDEWFSFYDNIHGSFMFFCHELALINYIPKLMSLNLSYFLFDFRDKGLEQMQQVTKIYQESIEDYLKNKDHFDGESFSDKIEKIYPLGITEGFFIDNTSDKQVQQNKTESLEPVAKVIGTVKEKVMAIEVLSPFSIGDELCIETPEGKKFAFHPHFYRNTKGEDINSPHLGEIIILNWKKGVTAESKIYRHCSGRY